MKRNRKQKVVVSGSDRNLLVAVIGLVLCSLAASIYVAWVSGFVLESLQNSNTMALLITDAGVRSDDANLEHQLSSAGVALQSARDFGYALGVGSIGVLVAVLIRIRRQSRS
jgi:hypothetical protein